MLKYSESGNKLNMFHHGTGHNPLTTLVKYTKIYTLEEYNRKILPFNDNHHTMIPLIKP